MYQINTLLWPIKNNSDTIELTVHTSCYCIWTYSVLFGSLSHLLNIYLLQHTTDLTTMALSTFQGQQTLNLLSFGNNEQSFIFSLLQPPTLLFDFVLWFD